MTNLAFRLVQINLHAEYVNGAEVDDALNMIRDEKLTDVLVLSHGWNNGRTAATALYDHVMTSMKSLLEGELKDAFRNRRVGVIGLLWPSLRYADDSEKPGGAAALGDRDSLKQKLADARDLFEGMEGSPLPKVLAQLEKKIAVIEDSEKYVKLLTEAIEQQLQASETVQHEAVPVLDNLTLSNVKQSLTSRVSGAGQEASGAAGIGSGARLRILDNLLNITTYYEMKDRAGRVGMLRVRDLLIRIRAAFPEVRIHLAGHSFGGRVVTAAARGMDGDQPLPIHSMTLLQAAFSHQGLGTKSDQLPEGYFRRVVDSQQVVGPILITHTKHDRAVGLAYALASALAGQNAAAIGDRDDPYGAIGSNGALNANAIELEVDDATTFKFEAGRIHNLHADIIKDHGDVTQVGVVRAMLYGMLVNPGKVQLPPDPVNVQAPQPPKPDSEVQKRRQDKEKIMEHLKGKNRKGDGS